MAMQERLAEIERIYNELTEQLATPEVASDPVRLRELGKRHSELYDIIAAHRAREAALRHAAEARAMARDERDPEMAAFLRNEEAEAERRAAELGQQLEVLLLPRDPNDDKSVVLEVRAGTGGREAALFAADLLEMYQNYAERHGWKTEVLSSSPSELGGFKEVVVEVRGKGAYSRLKHESGVHRVQRIPVTESGGRIHTSTATVAVLPEAEETEVQINPKDLEIDVFRSSGPGGQSVNTTDSAVRITHKPTGIKVEVQEERSQRQNREKAMRYLRARLLKTAQDEQQREEAATRRAQVGTGERSEKIRTYNFPQNRVTDHRANLSVHNLQAVMAGDLDQFVDALFASNESSAVGAAQALHDRKGKVKLVGFDSSPRLLEDLKSGIIDSLVVQDPFRMAPAGRDPRASLRADRRIGHAHRPVVRPSLVPALQGHALAVPHRPAAVLGPHAEGGCRGVRSPPRDGDRCSLRARGHQRRDGSGRPRHWNRDRRGRPHLEEAPPRCQGDRHRPVSGRGRPRSIERRRSGSGHRGCGG